MKHYSTSDEKQLLDDFSNLLTCDSLQQLCDYCAELLHCDVLVTTDDHYILAQNCHAAGNECRLCETYPYFPPVIIEEQANSEISYGLLPQATGEMLPVSVVRIVTEHQQLGLLYMLTPQKDITAMPIFSWVLRAFTTFLLPLHLQFQHGDPISSFLSQLLGSEPLQHNKNTEAILNQRIKDLGISLDDHKYIAVLRIIPTQYTHYMEFCALKDDLAALVPNSYLFIHDNNLCILFSRHNVVPALSQYLKKFQDYAHAHNLLCGVSSNFGTLLDLKHWYQYAQDVIEQGMLMNNEENVYYFDDYMGFMLYRVCNRDINLKDFCSPAIKGLLFYDEYHGTNHLLTLHTYLMHRQNTTLTAEALQCHRNTVKYRINQICELFQLDLSDGASVYPLARSLEILQYLGQLPRPSEIPFS